MSDCIFCKILSGEMGVEFLLEDEYCKIFRDHAPKAPTHLLIVPHKHIEKISDMEELDSEIVGKMVFAAKRVADELSLNGYRLQFNVGAAAGQEVFHIHLHLMSNTAS